VRRVWRLTGVLLRDWVRNREAMFFAVLFPVILLVVFSLVFAGGPTQFDVAVQNNDVGPEGEPSELSAEFVDALETADPLVVHHLHSDSDLRNVSDVEATTGYRRVVVVPDGFGERARASAGRVRATVIRDTVARGPLSDAQRENASAALAALDGGDADRDPSTVVLLTVPGDDGAGAVRSVLGSVTARFNDRSLGVEEPTAVVAARERGAAGVGATGYYLPAFVVAMVLINGVMTVPSTVASFRRDGTLKRLAATPLRRHEWVLANVVQQSVLAVAIAGVLVLVARVAFGVSAVPGPLAVALIAVGAVAFSALGMVVGSVIRDPGSAISLGGAIALPLLFLSGVFWELDLMPPTLQMVAEYSPVTHFHRSLRELMVLDSTAGVTSTFGLLGTLAVVFVAAAVAATNWQEFD
jgi:ABC-2 type transport system permease protein